MTTQEVANRLYELCSQNKFEEAQDELFANDATSTEKGQDGQWGTVTGIPAIKEKGRQFQSMIVEMHSGYNKEPQVFGNHIFMEMGMNVTMKGMPRMDMNEMCEYEVKNGKIISERFYY